MKILIADDNPDIVEILKLMLSLQGEIRAVGNGNDVLEAVHIALADSSPYDLICLDIMMPRMDGREALRGIRRLEGEYGIMFGDGAKVIMISALGNGENIFGAFHRDGCDGYITKPFQRDEVINTFKRIGLSWNESK